MGVGGCGWCRVERVAEGVYAVIDVDGGWFRSNSGLIDAGRYTIVVDTQYNERRARDLERLIGELGLPRPGLVINTHHHGDHAWGNHVFNAPSIMHEGAAKMVELLKDIAPDMYKPFFPNLDFTGSKYTTPDIVISGPLTINTQNGKIRLKHFGPAHTVGDIVVEVEWARTAFLGDLMFNRVTPLALDGTVAGWEKVLERLVKEYGGWRLVGGHGPVGDTEVLKKIAEYFRQIIETTEKLLGAGVRDPLTIALEIRSGPLSGWSEEERVVLNVARAIMDLEGKPPGMLAENLPQLAMEMAEYSSRTDSRA
ncbi:MAG: MBL fold metallo-hydrolase [Desulfurococcales archaeon]|nr:MBL fold metallo-hydrolase [Desulfurococcales archaeon]